MRFIKAIRNNDVWGKLIDSFGYEIEDLEDDRLIRNFKMESFGYLLKVFKGDVGDTTYSDIPNSYKFDNGDPEYMGDCVNEFLLDFEDGIEFITDVKDDPDDYSSEWLRKAVVRFGDEYFAWYYYSSSFGNSGVSVDEFFNSLVKVHKKVEVIVTFE